MFLAPLFAVAGLVAAAGPILIHLLNRRRYRVVPWGAMDFLREAIFRNRRIMQLRDLLLLALRTLCILLFGLAMAQPFLGRAVVGIDRSQPIHAVLLLDNSLSMGYRELNDTLLERAKAQARELIEELPRGSRISVLPICGSAAGHRFSYAAYYTKEDALEALEMIEPVDRAALAGVTVDLAIEACDRVPEMAAKEIVLLTDSQVSNWSSDSLAARLGTGEQYKLPCPIKVIQLKPELSPGQYVENAWIADFRLRDEVADRQTPGVFVATVRYEGARPQYDVQVALTVDGLTFDVQSIELQPGQTRQVEFAPCRFEDPQGDDKFRYAAAEVSVTLRRGGAAEPDGLPADDRRFLIVPVVERLPVVFVDQWGDDEQPARNRYGETYHLRQLLAPNVGVGQRSRAAVTARHVRIEQVDRDLLSDARLVIIAGVATPEQYSPEQYSPESAASSSVVSLLREYVVQGGNLLIAAGGHFDPALWNEHAWQDGLGILPAPLSPVTFGRLPAESEFAASSQQYEAFQLDYNSLKNHDYFLLEGTSDEELQDLYRLPYFFKTVEADIRDEVKKTMTAAMAEHLEQHRGDLDEIEKQLAELAELEARQPLSPSDRSRQDELKRQRAELRPAWLLWADHRQGEDGLLSRQYAPSSGNTPEELAERTKFSVSPWQVVARYDNSLPYMIERRIGRGRVLMITSGISSEWNTLSLTNTVLVFDRVFRRLLSQTLPQRNLDCQRPHVLPVALPWGNTPHRNARIVLHGPALPGKGGSEELLSIDAMGTDRYEVTLDNLTQRGFYRLTASRPNDAPSRSNTPAGAEDVLWEIPLAAGGPAGESELVSAEQIQLRSARGQGDSIATAGAFSLAGFQRAQLRGTDLWKWIMLAVLACLVVELLILAWPSMSAQSTTKPPNATSR